MFCLWLKKLTSMPDKVHLKFNTIAQNKQLYYVTSRNYKPKR